MTTAHASVKRVTRKKTTAPEYPLVTPEFRAEAHAKLDRVLDANPGTTALLIALARDAEVNAVSLPDAAAVKTGIIDELFRRTHPKMDLTLDIN